ncbi:MAG TPA: homoserine kinase [Calditrichia bacterium]|nr:homoserine kinase [Calditrichota bacterium]HQU71981.1 homoserine kinase [Calditrichia bacterium]HQV33614.1 homoserine kinase [Calditrichia bacterium]
MSRSLRAFAPATVANVACGFDVLGFAVENPGDEVILTLREQPGIEICAIHGDGGQLPLDPQQNAVGVVIGEYLRFIDAEKQGVRVELFKNMPLKSGMGSSAASSAVGVFAINQLMGNPLEAAQLLPFAMAGEKLACGAAHADNVAPALLGGFVLVRSYDPLDIVQLPMPDRLWCSLVHPHIEVQTRDARNILRREIPLRDAVVQWGNLGGLVAGILTADYGLIGRSMQDVIIEPMRSLLIPGFHDAKQAALEAGALGCSISGSGPSMFALSTDGETAARIGEVMTAVFRSLEIDARAYISKLSPRGPKVL